MTLAAVACWQGCVKCSATGNFLLTEKLGEVRGMMEAYGVKPNRRTYALQIEACLTEQELEVRLRATTVLNPNHNPDLVPTCAQNLCCPVASALLLLKISAPRPALGSQIVRMQTCSVLELPAL